MLCLIYERINAMFPWRSTWKSSVGLAFAAVVFAVSPLEAALTDDFNVTFFTNRGQDDTGTTGDPNMGITDSGNSSTGTHIATLTVVDSDTFKITMNSAMDSSTLFQITGVDWGSGGVIDTVSIGSQPNLQIPAAWLNDTSFAVRTTVALMTDDFFTIDVTGTHVHVPEPQTYVMLGSGLGAVLLLVRRRKRTS